MINIIDTCKNVLGDKYAVIKLGIMAVPLVMGIYAYNGGQMIVANTLNIVIGVIYLAIFCETMKRSCAGEPMLMPPFMMPIKMFITLGETIVAAIPAAVVCGGMVYGYFELLNNVPELKEEIVSYTLITGAFILMILSIFFASVTQYSNSGKINSSYNVVKVVKALNTFIVDILSFAVQNALFFGLFGALPVYGIYIVAGFKWDNIVVYSYSSFYIVLNFIMLADFFAQTKKDSECD